MNKSMGKGINVVVFCSLVISDMVCRKRNCKTMGCTAIMPADAASPVENQISSPSFLAVIDNLNRGAALYAEYILRFRGRGCSSPRCSPRKLGKDGFF